MPTALHPAARIAAPSRRPTALPTRTLAAVAKPTAHMNTSASMFIAIW